MYEFIIMIEGDSSVGYSNDEPIAISRALPLPLLTPWYASADE
jgi:hypothetical protein